MLPNVLQAIQDLPVLAQGVAGSALFAILVFIGKHISRSSSTWFLTWTKEQKISAARDELLRLLSVQAEGEQIGVFASVLVYRSLRYAYTAAVWAVFAYMVDRVLPVVSTVFFAGCLYYLARALAAVEVTNANDNDDDRIREVRERLKKLSGKEEPE